MRETGIFNHQTWAVDNYQGLDVSQLEFCLKQVGVDLSQWTAEQHNRTTAVLLSEIHSGTCQLKVDFRRETDVLNVDGLDLFLQKQQESLSSVSENDDAEEKQADEEEVADKFSDKDARLSRVVECVECHIHSIFAGKHWSESYKKIAYII